MASPTPEELSDLLADRRSRAKHILNDWTGREHTYTDWSDRLDTFDNIYNDHWEVVWPDQLRSEGLAKIPNIVKIAIEDRARSVAAGRPTIVVRPEEGSEKSAMQAEKRERILGGYWQQSRVRQKIGGWAFDLMAAGVSVCKVMIDPSLQKKDRFPIYTRLDPRFCYPSPTFAQGPFVDDLIYGYTEKLSVIENRYGEEAKAMLRPIVELAKSKGMQEGSQARVREYYDSERIVVCVELDAVDAYGHSAYETIVDTKHELEYCPIAIGVRPSADGVYRGDFDATYAILNVLNKLVTLQLDSAVSHVYPDRKIYDVRNPEEWGPDAIVELNSPTSVYEYVTPGSAPFENQQMMSMLMRSAQEAALMPAARLGEPSQSIISAAGVSAVGGQGADHILSLQRDSVGPMLEAANWLAFCTDEIWGDAKKSIVGVQNGTAYTEKYEPGKDIGGNYRNEVAYPFGSGLGDEVNRNVMVMQQWNNGNGVISRETAMELSPMVEDHSREAKRISLEGIERSVIAGLQAKAQVPPEQGGLSVRQLAEIGKTFQSDTTTLIDAVMDVVGPDQTAPLAQVPGQAPPASAAGNAGAQQAAGAQQPQMNGPPLDQLLAGPRPGG